VFSLHFCSLTTPPPPLYGLFVFPALFFTRYLPSPFAPGFSRVRSFGGTCPALLFFASRCPVAPSACACHLPPQPSLKVAPVSLCYAFSCVLLLSVSRTVRVTAVCWAHVGFARHASAHTASRLVALPTPHHSKHLPTVDFAPSSHFPFFPLYALSEFLTSRALSGLPDQDFPPFDCGRVH